MKRVIDKDFSLKIDLTNGKTTGLFVFNFIYQHKEQGEDVEKTVVINKDIPRSTVLKILDEYDIEYSAKAIELFNRYKETYNNRAIAESLWRANSNDLRGLLKLVEKDPRATENTLEMIRFHLAGM
ncbi:hypothetical protein [Halobacteriovorax sp. CON-3]|uniref:hypothetical protein n=1 Tax=Halobacteriovorax sp. CON-3 TaxID=3157710 RepID=UPI00371C79D1